MKKYVVILFIGVLFFSFSYAQTRSFKRGLCYNTLMAEDIEALSPSLSWGYNWGHTGSGNNAAFQTYNLEFVPMAWSGIDKNVIRNYLSSHPEVKYILGFNEPNFKDQANLTPVQAAEKWPDIEEIADEFGLTIVGPAVNYSPDAPYQDPTTWYDEFFEVCSDCRVDHIAVHFYMPAMSAIKSNIERFKKYNRPIWLTEFCAWENNTTIATQKKFMIETFDYLETDPDVFRYAWFKERFVNTGNRAMPQEWPYMQLLDQRNEGVLKELGEIFAYMSSYDEDYYFTTNRQIPSEHYVRMKGISMEKTSDVTDHINVCEFDMGDWVSYNVDIPAAGEYNVSFRLAADYPDESEVRISVDGQEAGSMLFEKKGVGVWDTQHCKATFNAGKQTIRIDFKRGGLKLNWWSITQPGLSIETVSPADASVSAFTVFDLSGRKLIEKRNDPFPDLSSLKAGVYIVSVSTASDEKKSYKVIKK